MRKIRLLSIILTLCICLSLAIPAAYAAESTSYLEVSYAQASSLEVGQPITITGVANYNAHTSNDSTTLLAIDAPDGTWFAAIGSFSSDAFKATIGSCDVTLYGVYAGTMDINGMPIIDVQQGTLSYTGWLQSVSTPSLHTFVESSGSTAELLSPAQEVIDQAAAEAAAAAKAKEEAEAAAKAASTPQWKKTGKMVWIPTHGGHCYHSNPYCSGMISPEKVDLGYAKYMGFRNCKKC